MNRRVSLLGLAAALTLLGAAAAHADPITFQWNPSAVGVTPDTTFTANNITTADYVAINVTGPGPGPNTVAFSEQGIVNASAFVLNGGSTTPIDLGRVAPNGFVIFATFTATGNIAVTSLNPPVGTSTGGVFTAFSYDLWAAPANS